MAPITLHKDFIKDPKSLEDLLWKELPWIKHFDRPRSECWMNDFNLPYTYGAEKAAKTYEAVKWHPAIEAIRNRFLDECNIWLDSCFVNGYDDGHQHLGWHSDDSPEMDDNRPITVISLGAEREIWFRPKGNRDLSLIEKLSLPSGSLLIMAAGMQDTHDHRIPKSAIFNCPSRISLTYRGLLK